MRRAWCRDHHSAQTVVFDDGDWALQAVAAAQPETETRARTCAVRGFPGRLPRGGLDRCERCRRRGKLAAGVAAAKAAAKAGGESDAVIALIVDQSYGHHDPDSGTGNYIADYDTAANAITSNIKGDGQAAFEEHNTNYCPSMITSTPAVQSRAVAVWSRTLRRPLHGHGPGHSDRNRVGAAAADDDITKYNLYAVQVCVRPRERGPGGSVCGAQRLKHGAQPRRHPGCSQLRTLAKTDFPSAVPLPPFLEVNNTLAPTTRGRSSTARAWAGACLR